MRNVTPAYNVGEFLLKNLGEPIAIEVEGGAYIYTAQFVDTEQLQQLLQNEKEKDK